MIELARIRAVVWDVDGTLYSARELLLRLSAAFLLSFLAGRRGRELRDDLAALRRRRGLVERARVRGGELPVAARTIDRRSPHQLEERCLRAAIARIGARAGVVGVLELFAERGLPQVVLSDYEARYKLEALGLASYFSLLYAGAKIGFVKPSPAGLRRIAADLAIDPSRILLIGDRVDTDGGAAAAAGCRALVLGRDFTDFDQLRLWLSLRGRLRSS